MQPLLYLAYGSNMLTRRLQARCSSARPVGPGLIFNHAIAFSKRGQDGSGKATLVARSGASVPGVLFHLDFEDRPVLDRFEGAGRGYDRHDAMNVRGADGETVTAFTYIAPPDMCDPNLRPFDWYLGLVEAGAREHGLPDAHCRALSQIETIADPDAERPGHVEARVLLAIP